MATVNNNTESCLNAFENACKNALNEIAVTGNVDLVANCVVHIIQPGEKYSGVPGTLRRGHSYKVNGVKSVTWGNYVKYAVFVEFVNFTKKGKRDWFRRTLRADKGKFKLILESHLKKVGD